MWLWIRAVRTVLMRGSYPTCCGISGQARRPAGSSLLARVKKEDVQAESRADIVVMMPSHTLVIELKVHSGEGDDRHSAASR